MRFADSPKMQSVEAVTFSLLEPTEMPCVKNTLTPLRNFLGVKSTDILQALEAPSQERRPYLAHFRSNVETDCAVGLRHVLQNVGGVMLYIYDAGMKVLGYLWCWIDNGKFQQTNKQIQ